MNPYVGIAIGGLIFIFACIGLGLCIRCMSKFHSSGERDVTGENESVLSETEAQRRERNRTELILEQQERNSTLTDIPLPSYEEVLIQPRNDEVNGSTADEGLGKVRLGEESPPHYEVAKEKEDMNSEPAL